MKWNNGKYGRRVGNGMDFSKSVKNPNSRLVRVVKYLRENPKSTWKEILRDVFNIYPVPKDSYHSWKIDGNGRGTMVTKGYGSSFKTLLIVTKFVKVTGRGVSTRYSVGSRSRLIP